MSAAERGDVMRAAFRQYLRARRRQSDCGGVILPGRMPQPRFRDRRATSKHYIERRRRPRSRHATHQRPVARMLVRDISSRARPWRSRPCPTSRLDTWYGSASLTARNLAERPRRSGSARRRACVRATRQVRWTEPDDPPLAGTRPGAGVFEAGIVAMIMRVR